MPVVNSGKVLVTGANGFVAMWIIDSLLKQGYAVRAVVRSADKGAHITQVFAEYEARLEIATVEDMTAKGAFDEAVRGVDAIMHTASPVKLELCEPSGVILPAVGGTTGLIESVISHGPSVKRVVYTSTCGAVLTPSREPRIYNENDWNDWSVRHCQEKGRDALPEWKYCASKVLAERAAWEMYEKHKAENKWDLVTIVPPWVYGPVLNASPSPKSLNSSMFEFYNAVFTTQKSEAELVSEGGGWIDVRDLADAHVKAITLPEAGGERIIVSTGSWRWQDWGSFPFIHTSGPFTALLTILYISVNTAQSLSSKVVARDIFLNPKIAVHNTGYDLSKMKAILGPSRRSMLETTVDIIKDFESKCWLN